MAPAGRGAEQIATLFWWMSGAAAVIWLAVIALGVYAIYGYSDTRGRRGTVIIVGGGAIFPTLVLTILLLFGLPALPALTAPAPEGSLTIEVTGEQWWWRVRYIQPDGEHVELANHIRLPVGEPVEFQLNSADVIHSFWIPSLGGKMDMIPGRQTRLALEPTKTGTFRGACAEYCGEAHALMNFWVVVEEQAAFEEWLQSESKDAAAPSGELARRGAQVFLANGCGACHTIRGTGADGVIGPDLTHVGSRLSIGAGILPNDANAFLDWIAYTEQLKPAVHMPSFGMLPEEDLRALAAYLDGLE